MWGGEGKYVRGTRGKPNHAEQIIWGRVSVLFVLWHSYLISTPGPTKETTRIINECIVKQSDGSFKLILGSCRIQEAKKKFDQHKVQNMIVSVPTLMAPNRWGSDEQFKLALNQGQAWLDEEDETIAHWKEGVEKKTDGSYHEYGTEQGKKTNAAGHAMMQGVLDKMTAKSLTNFGSQSSGSSDIPLKLLDCGIAREVKEEMDKAIEGAEIHIKEAEKLTEKLLAMPDLPERAHAIVEAITAASEDTKDHCRVLERVRRSPQQIKSKR